MKLLVFGQSGQLARALAAAEAGPCLGRDQADLSVPGSAAEAVHAHAPDVVINAAAYTAVDQAEDDRAAAFRINGEAVGEIAGATAETGAAMIHISTDYVYDGTKQGPYREDDPVAPINAYGASKLAGERAARSANPRTVILRTAWVYAPWGRNFVTTMLRLGSERERISVVDDQIGSPTSAIDLAEACLAIAPRLAGASASATHWGAHHFAGAGAPASWAAFAAEIFRIADCLARATPVIDAIPGADYPTAARRPVNSALDCAKFTRTFGLSPPPWRQSLRRDVLALCAGAG